MSEPKLLSQQGNLSRTAVDSIISAKNPMYKLPIHPQINGLTEDTLLTLAYYSAASLLENRQKSLRHPTGTSVISV